MLLDARDHTIECERRRNTERFSQLTGGYELIGVVASLILRLVRQVSIDL